MHELTPTLLENKKILENINTIYLFAKHNIIIEELIPIIAKLEYLPLNKMLKKLEKINNIKIIIAVWQYGKNLEFSSKYFEEIEKIVKNA